MLAFGGVLFATVFAQARPPTVVVTATHISVKSGFYTADAAFQDVTEVRLDPALPRILRRTNGFAGGGSLRGHFEVGALGGGQLFVDVGHPPFVFVRTRREFFFVNYQDPARTEALYRTLLASTNAKGP